MGRVENGVRGRGEWEWEWEWEWERERGWAIKFIEMAWHIIFSLSGKKDMEKRVIGMILTLLGIVGLIAAGYFFMRGGENTTAFKSIALYGILGFIFFIAGVGLVRNTKDKAT